MKLQLSKINNSQKEKSTKGASELKDFTMEKKIISFFRPSNNLNS